MSEREPTKKRMTVKISGHVQGVGFRYYTRSKAQSLGLRGWVQNEPDGSVTVVCEGDEASLLEFSKWLESGPPSARVSNFHTRFADFRGEFSSFSIH